MQLIEYDYCFVYLNILDGVFRGADYELNSSYIRSYLKSRNITSVQYIDLDGRSISDLVCGMQKVSCRCYVFYISDYNYYISKVVINTLASKSCADGIIVIGPVSRYIMKHFREDISADYFCCANECDTLNQIIRSEKISFSKPIEAVRVPLAEIPQPYSNGVVPAKEAVNMGLITSKGCIGCCNFCSYSEKGAIREFYPVEAVIDELNYIKDNIGDCGHKLFFYDDCFSGDTERTIRLCDAIINAELGFKFWCCTRLDLLNETVIDKFAEAGFDNVVIGLESASERILPTIGKIASSDTYQSFIDKMVRMCAYAKSRLMNLVVSVNFGLIGEQTEDAAQTIDFIEKNNIPHISVNYMTIFPKSRVFVENFCQLSNCCQSPEKLPMRTFFDRRMMYYVTKRIAGVSGELKAENALKEQKRKAEVIGLYTGITYERNKSIRLVEWKKENIKPEVLEKKLIHDYYVVDCEKIVPNEVYCDNRKELKIKIEEYDDVINWAYHHDLYMEHVLFRTIKDGQAYLKAHNYLTGRILRYRYFGERFSDKLQHIIAKYSYFTTHTCLSLREDIEDTLCDDMQAFSSDCFTEALTPENRCLYDAYTSKFPYAYVFVNFCVFVAKNTNAASEKNVLYAYSKLNSDIDNQIISFPKNVVIAIIDNRVLVYNASLKHCYFCNEDDGRAVSAIIRHEISESDEDSVRLFAKRLVMHGIIHEECFLRRA